ncbi:nuclear transport factor 2 family protein [Streptomyces atratus]|uniref:nuclear transport factor 2 family protein n=1 Tax=Streptomyces atratus TaxID=1893 RepID=UPI0022503967|nr:nuclear transport factor 2 family protein [Streptomyces atratus]MCX5345749.1 nuclear transport factor 2 family protein [Streptomyces atratus]
MTHHSHSHGHGHGTDFATSDAPADVVRRQYLASAAGDLEALRATLAPDVEWTEIAGFPPRRHLPHARGRHVERDGAARPGVGRLTAHDDTYVVDGENVVVLARYTAVNKATRKPIDVRVAHHFVVRGGRIVRFEQFVDTAKVRDAMTSTS